MSISPEHSSEHDIAFQDLKRLFSGADSLNDIDSETLALFTLNQIQAIVARKIATDSRLSDIENTEELVERARKLSREVLARTSQAVDHDVLDLLFNTEHATEINYTQVIEFLKSRGITHLPVLSTTPQNVLDNLNANQDFTFQTIPADQVGLTDFNQVFRESTIPDWFRDAQADQAAQREIRPLTEVIQERWFLILIVLLGLLAGVSFSLDIGLNVKEVMGNVDLYISVYGAVAISRAVWQTSRAERWNRETRHEIRSEYEVGMLQFIDEIEDPELAQAVANDPKLATLKRRLHTTTTKSNPWDTFRSRMGLDTDAPKGGHIDQLLSIINTHVAEINHQRQGTDQPTLRGYERYSLVERLTASMVTEQFPEGTPSVAIVIPTYQTSLEEMEGLLVSIKEQYYPVTTAYVVYNDDPNGSEPKREQFLKFQELVTRMNSQPGNNQCRFHLLAQPSRGKREAMGMAFAMGRGQQFLRDLQEKYPEVETDDLRFMIANLDLAALPDFTHDFILNIDSDTKIGDPFAVLNSAILMNRHPDAATTTGDVRVVNRNINLLSEMTYQRYWHAFFKERAAQAPEVTCMSGPWVFMRSEALAEILDEWYFQEFLEQRATYGDDRNLSTRFLERGWKSLFNPDSFVLTDCPTEFRVFLKQQLRWNKSFNRENLILFTFIHKLSKFVQLDTVYQQTFPFIMLYILANISVNAATIGAEQGLGAGLASTLPYAGTVLVFNEIFYGLYGATKNRDPRFLLSPVYIGYHFGALLWLKLYAIFQMKDTSWGTKGEQFDAKANDGTLDEAEVDQLADEIEAQVDELLASTDTEFRSSDEMTGFGSETTASEGSKYDSPDEETDE